MAQPPTHAHATLATLTPACVHSALTRAGPAGIYRVFAAIHAPIGAKHANASVMKTGW